MYDLELGSGRSYYYEPALNRCKEIDFPVGILKPDWLKVSFSILPLRGTDKLLLLVD